MRKNLTKYLILLALPVSLLSCGRKESGGANATPYVESIIADTTSREYGLVSAYNPHKREASIAVVGGPREVILMTEALLVSDRFSNVDGSSSPDGLPDFAGESIVPVIIPEISRETVARGFVAAMDTLVHADVSDAERSLVKLPAKIVVLASPEVRDNGYSDVDTLCAVIGRAVPVVAVPADADTSFAAGADAVARGCFRIMRKANIFTHKVAYPEMKAYFTAADGMIVPLSDKYLTVEMTEFMELSAPNTFTQYVR